MRDLRADWLKEQDNHYMNVLEGSLQDFYTCIRPPRPSGALLLLDKPGYGVTMIIGGVFPPIGSPSCKDLGECMIVDGHCVRNIHAEVATFLNAAQLGISTLSATLYSWNKPCYGCTIAAIGAGIVRIVYKFAVYDEERTSQAIKNAGIICEEWKL